MSTVSDSTPLNGADSIATTKRSRLLATGTLILLTLVQLARLSWLHDYVPLWVEGLTEYQNALSALLGFRTETLPCTLSIRGWQIPLGVTPYVGGGFIYLNAPLVAIWFHGWTSDPYLFRYTGISAYLASGWLIYFLAGRFWSLKTAWWAAVLWLTTPDLFFVAIADLQWELEPAALALLSVALFLLSFEKEKASFFLAGCAVLGFVSTTRLDAFVLFVICVSSYLLLVRPAAVLMPAASMIRRRKWLIPAGIAAAGMGALPLILFNVVCPWGRLLPFVNNVILGSALSENTAQFGLRMRLRVLQYFFVNVFHQMPFLDIFHKNFAFAVAFFVALTVLVASIRRGWISFPLLALALAVPLSVLSGVLRPEHMIPFQLFTTLLVAIGLSSDDENIRQIFKSKNGTRIRQSLLVAALCGNFITQAMDWRSWQKPTPNQDTIVNQSAPQALNEYLKRVGPDDRVFFISIGLHLYQSYMTAGRFNSENIVTWEGEKQFIARVEGILRERERRRIFAGTTLDRDESRFNMVRTKFLLETLKKHRVPYKRVTLSTSRRLNLYDIVTVEPGDGIR